MPACSLVIVTVDLSDASVYFSTDSTIAFEKHDETFDTPPVSYRSSHRSMEDDPDCETSRFHSSSTRYFAVKRLKPSRISDPHARDSFRNEALILSSLKGHSNLIKMYAVFPCHDESPPDSLPFIIVDRLNKTLSDCLRRWRILQPHIPSRLLPKSREKKVRILQRDRLGMVAVGLSRALRHIHLNGILHRDINPSNVGFDCSGNVRLFDFGLAEAVSSRSGDDKVHTQMVGTLRYMSPECASSVNYGFAVDVYSFSLILWETATLKIPFEDVRDHSRLLRFISQKNARPPLRAVACSSTRKLIQSAWHHNPDERPTFCAIVPEVERNFRVPCF